MMGKTKNSGRMIESTNRQDGKEANGDKKVSESSESAQRNANALISGGRPRCVPPIG